MNAINSISMPYSSPTVVVGDLGYIPMGKWGSTVIGQGCLSHLLQVHGGTTVWTRKLLSYCCFCATQCLVGSIF